MTEPAGQAPCPSCGRVFAASTIRPRALGEAVKRGDHESNAISTIFASAVIGTADVGNELKVCASLSRGRRLERVPPAGSYGIFS
jgi:hypothetical protein